MWPAVLVLHSRSRTLPNLDEVLRTFHRQTFFTAAVYDRKYMYLFSGKSKKPDKTLPTVAFTTKGAK
jgi:hypothetical protein